MYSIDLSGRTGVVFGVANQRSIAWAIAQILHQAGAKLAIAYQNERLKENVEKLTADWGDVTLLECDVSQDASVEAAFATLKDKLGRLDIVVHSIAFANREDLGGRFVNTPREGFRLALDVSAYSLIAVARHAAPLMAPVGGSIITMTFQAAERVFPGYNVMGTAKAALENEVRQLASDLGQENVRVNAISAGPVDTLSSRVISGYSVMKGAHSDRAPMRRNITVEEVAKTALYLCSDLSSGVTGEVIHVDTGYHVMGI
ncbi:MAG: enoyl-ACP reductase [SAR202 cluster bacterium]|nr:enoyl-ACP reductase [SAR202 cluster bacterium]